MGWPPPPPPKINFGLFGTWDSFEAELPPKKIRNKLNMKNIGTKLINMSDIMVFLAMFSTIIDQI